MTIAQIEAQLRAKLEADQEEDVLDLQVHEAIAKVLAAFVGKKLTKRFTDKVTAAIIPLFQSRPIVFYPNPGELVIWGTNRIAYDQRRVFYIAGTGHHLHPDHSREHPTMEGFEYTDQTHGSAAKARIEERAWLLAEENPTLDILAEKIVKVRTAKEELARVLEPLVSGVRYQAEHLVDERE